jgi:hypothetical protein
MNKVYIADLCCFILFYPYTFQLKVLDTLSPNINPLTPELNPSVQRCLTRYITGDFAF